MKRYIALTVCGGASLLMYLSQPFGDGAMSITEGWPDGVILALVVFFLSAPTIVVIILAYDITAKLAHRVLGLTRLGSRLAAVAATLACVFGIPFVFDQILKRQVIAELADDRPAVLIAPYNAPPSVRFETTQPHGQQCNADCRTLLRTNSLASFTASDADQSETTYAFATGGTCLGPEAFFSERDTPDDTNPSSPDGRCIIAVPPPPAFDLVVRETRYPADSHLRGTRTLITDGSGQTLYRRSDVWPQRPLYILGLVTEQISANGPSIRFGLTRFGGAHRTGTDQSPREALLTLAQP